MNPNVSNTAYRPAAGHVGAMVLGVLVLLAAERAGAEQIEVSQEATLKVERIAGGLSHPWGLAFLPDGRFLVTERSGRLYVLDGDGGQRRQVAGLPDIEPRGQGGLLDVALHPEFAENRWIYMSYAGPGDGGVGTEVARGRWNGHDLEDTEVIFRLEPKSGAGQHFGSRLVFDGAGRLYVTLGDRGNRPRAQDLDDHAGSVVRINDDGSIPADNPFVDRADARPEIFSYGNRNIQGAALHPGTGELWTHEHGPRGGDEVNIIRAGVNYGWPVITYGVNYGTGTAIGEGTHKEGMAQPLYYWDPSIAPSGMAFYTAERIPGWQGDLLVGSLKFATLVRLELDGEEVVHEERLLRGDLGRIRDVRQGPDGLVYLLTDEDDGGLYRLGPALEKR